MRIFSNEKSETRYIREIIYGQKEAVTYWEITTVPETMSENSTSLVMTNIKRKIKKILGNIYGLRTSVEYGFRQSKQELGWTDYRFTNFKDIEKWWEIIFCVYLMISLNSQAFLSLNQFHPTEADSYSTSVDFSTHQQWDHESARQNLRRRESSGGTDTKTTVLIKNDYDLTTYQLDKEGCTFCVEKFHGWKHSLNNFRLIAQPILLLSFIYTWLDIFPNADLLLGFSNLICAMN